MAEKKGDAEQARFPEEQNPSGHDAEPAREVTPSRIVTEQRKDRDVGGHPASAAPQPAVDAAFLSTQFAMSPKQAAKLVSDRSAPAETSHQVERVARGVISEATDPLKGVPTPREPAQDLTTDVDEERLKPVLHTPNGRPARRR